MNRRVGYEMLGIVTLALSAAATVLAVAGAAFQQTLGVGAASLCAVLLVVPGLYFLGYSRRLGARDLALAHTAAFVKARGDIRIQDLAEELHASPATTRHVLRIAVQEGHVRGHFEGDARFVAERPHPPEEVE